MKASDLSFTERTVTPTGKPGHKGHRYAWGRCGRCGNRQLVQGLKTGAVSGTPVCVMTPGCPGRLEPAGETPVETVGAAFDATVVEDDLGGAA